MSLTGIGGLVGALLQGGIGKELYDSLQTRVTTIGTDVGEYGDAYSDAEGADNSMFATLGNDVGGAGNFKGYTMRAGQGANQLGTSGMSDTGDLTMDLGANQQAYSNFLRTGAQDMYGRATGGNAFGSQAQTFFDRAAQNPAQRETDVYNRIREMQRPGEERQRDQMTSNLFGSGRGGMSSGAYGASPEEYGFNMARNEAMNQASYQAMGQAQQEMQNYQNMGQSLYGMGQQNQAMYGQLAGQMGAAQYDPYNMLMQQNQQGMAGGQMMNQSGQAMAGLLAQLGLGSATTDVNLQQVDASAFSGLMEMLGLAASGAGSAIDDIIAS